ncbi:MAG: histidine phosphatase family protein [Succinivibrio sp.]|nr:histidine phosphatase family protein [Succinivibrio sp.]
MEIIIMRHGEAQPLNGDKVLSNLGREQVQHSAQQLAGLHFEAAFCSPKTRARQTAELVLAAQDSQLALNISESLQPESEPESFLGELFAQFSREGACRVLVVSHLPLVARLCESLHCPEAAGGFAPAAFVRLSYDSTHRSFVATR